MTDEEIIGLFRNGQTERAFKELVAAYGERLYWHVRRFVCSHEDTDDLLQEIFIKVWSAMPSFRGDSRLFTWVYRIATNETLNWLHKQKVRSMLKFESLDNTLAGRIEADPYLNGNEVQKALIKAMARLPERQKTVFAMRYLDELSYEEISEILGRSVGALKASYHFATEKIRAEIEKGLGRN